MAHRLCMIHSGTTRKAVGANNQRQLHTILSPLLKTRIPIFHTPTPPQYDPSKYVPDYTWLVATQILKSSRNRLPDLPIGLASLTSPLLLPSLPTSTPRPSNYIGPSYITPSSCDGLSITAVDPDHKPIDTDRITTSSPEAFARFRWSLDTLKLSSVETSRFLSIQAINARHTRRLADRFIQCSHTKVSPYHGPSPYQLYRSITPSLHIFCHIKTILRLVRPNLLQP